MSDHRFDSLSDFLALMKVLAGDPATAPAAARMSDALLHVLASGPFLAELQGMIATAQENGVMYGAPISEQQRANILGMVATMQAVHDLLDPHRP